MKNKTNAEMLPSLVDLNNRKVADIGCGDGSLVRLMTRHGAKVIGVECNARMLAQARAAKPAGGEFYSEGVGEDLPFDDRKLDLIIFFNSLHHIDLDKQGTALAEAARVLKKDGQVYVAEPLAEGPNFEMMQSVHDETEVRAAAYRAIKKTSSHGLSEQLEKTYTNPRLYTDFEAMQEGLLTVNPQLKKPFADNSEEIHARFKKLGRKTSAGIVFDQPMRVNLLQKI